MLTLEPVVVKSVDPLEGQEGTIVTLRGSGFASHIRNSCIVIGGMGACARAEPDSTPERLKVRIGPVASVTEGDLLMWPGIGSDLHTERISHGRTSLLLEETAIFRNGAPTTSANVNFKLTKASRNTYGGALAKSSNVELNGHENGTALRIAFPKDLRLPPRPIVDICLVLKEPTLAIDFTAAITGDAKNNEEIVRAIAKTITVNASLVGEKVVTDVVRNRRTGEVELYVTKPYLDNGMFTVHFRSGRSQGGRR